MKTKVCSFIGHRTINETEELKARLYTIIENLIVNENVDTFLFGSMSRFSDLCYEIVSECKEKYPHIKRVYVRAEYPYINDEYLSYLLEYYEDTYYPERIIGAGRAVYIERNDEMIRNSDFCVFYVHEADAPVTRKSGAQIAFSHAVKQNKKLIKLP